MLISFGSLRKKAFEAHPRIREITKAVERFKNDIKTLQDQLSESPVLKKSSSAVPTLELENKVLRNLEKEMWSTSTPTSSESSPREDGLQNNYSIVSVTSVRINMNC